MTDDSDIEIRPIWTMEEVEEALARESQQEQKR
jgi:hypothetical protein